MPYVCLSVPSFFLFLLYTYAHTHIHTKFNVCFLQSISKGKTTDISIIITKLDISGFYQNLKRTTVESSCVEQQLVTFASNNIVCSSYEYLFLGFQNNNKKENSKYVSENL